MELSTTLTNFAGFTLITLLFLVAGAILVAQNRTIGRQARIVFLASCAALFCIALVDWFNFSFADRLPTFGPFQAISTMLTFAVAPAIPVAISQTIFPERHVHWIFVVLGLHALFEVISLFGGFVFWVDATNTYHRGPLYIVYMICYTTSALYLSVESIRAGHIYQSVNITSILAILCVMVAGVGVQVYDGTIRTTWPAVAMAVLLYFQFYSDMILRTDALTKLLNRHSYHEFLAHPPLPCTVVVIDVNDFKHVNDTYGHAYGDVCLSTIADLIRRSYGAAGLCYRTGGDEFMAVLTKRQDEREQFTSMLNGLVAKEKAKDERIPSVSVGYAVARENCPNMEEVIAMADKRMYEAKRANKVGSAR